MILLVFFRIDLHICCQLYTEQRGEVSFRREATKVVPSANIP